jgi:hypothetical protein
MLSSLKSVTSQECLVLPFVFNAVLVSLAMKIRQGKEIKGIRIKKE